MSIAEDRLFDDLHWNVAHANAGRYAEGVSYVFGSNARVYIANTAAAKGSAVDLTANPVSGDGSMTADWVYAIDNPVAPSPGGRGFLDPAGGTIALPTAATASVRPGEALAALEYFVVASDGVVGTTPVQAGDKLYVRGNTLPPVADADFIISHGDSQTGGYTTQQFTLTAAQITGGVTISGTPMAPAETLLLIEGAPNQAYTSGYTVAGTTLSFTPALQALLTVGKIITVSWK